MGGWNTKYRWDFPLAGSGDDVGFNETGIGMFKSQPYPSLAKEIIQNVLDARGNYIPEDQPVEVKFTLMEIDKNDIPGADQLAETIDACCDYYKTGDNHEKMLQVKGYSDEHLKKSGKIPVLKISDYNTTGLVGVDDPNNQEKCWYGLVKSSSSTNKSDGSSGSQGVGKFAAYTFTRLRTVLYSTKTEDGHNGFQGKTILITFRDADGNKRVNRARFGEPKREDVLPITDGQDIPAVFQRTEIGTDIYIVGFEKDNDWLQQMAMSVMEYFFYAIYKGTLEVELEDGSNKIHIGKDNIGEQISEYDEYYKNSEYVDDENFQYTAPLYWKAVTDNSENHCHITDTFSYRSKSMSKSMGDYELYLLMGPDVKDRRILEMRKAGMKIREDTKFRIQPSFLGVFIATGNGAASLKPEDNISSFLRKCENPSHDAWSPSNYSEEKAKAKSIISSIHKLILDFVKSKMPQSDENEIKAYGVNDLLVSQGEGSSEEDKEDAFMTASPEPIELFTSKSNVQKSRDLSRPSNGRGKKTRKKKVRKERQDEHRNNRNNKSGHKKKSISSISLRSIKTPFNEEKGVFKIIFVSDKDVSNLRLSLNVIGDDGSSETADVTDAEMNNSVLDIKEDCVVVPSVKAGDKNIVEIRLRGNRRERLEVSAYGEL